MNPVLQKNLAHTFGLEALSEEEKVAFLNDLGGVVMETALVRFMADLSPEQVASLEHYLDSEPELEAMMEHLLTHYKGFEAALEEAMVEIRSDTEAILGTEGEASEEETKKETE